VANIALEVANIALEVANIALEVGRVTADSPNLPGERVEELQDLGFRFFGHAFS